MSSEQQPRKSSPVHDDRPDAAAALTQREWEIIRLVALGRSDPEIGQALCIGASTVHTHLTNIYRKLDLRGKVQLAFWYGERIGQSRDLNVGLDDHDEGGEIEETTP